MTAAAAAVVVAVCLIASALMARQMRQWDRQDADERARLVIEDAERQVRVAESRRNHPSNRGEL